MSTQKRKTILLVEDDTFIAMDQAMTLKSNGYQVITVQTGEKAVEAIQAYPEIDLVLMDINLGAGMDGTQAAEIILKQRDLPLIFLSSHTNPEVVEKTEGITSYGYVVKNSDNSDNTVLLASIKMAFRLFESRQKERQKGEALRKSQQLLERMFISLNEAVFIIDASTVKILDCNTAASEIFGYSREEMVGRTTAFLHVDEAKFEEFRVNLFSAVQQKGRLFLSGFRMKRKNGTIFPTEHSVAPLEDEKGQRIGWISVVRDFTERKNAEKALISSERKYRDIFENALEGIFQSTPDGRLLAVNPFFAQIAGFDSPKQMLTGVTDIARQLYVDPGEREKLKQLLAEHGQVEGYEVQAYGKNKSKIWISLNMQTVSDSTGRILYFQGMFNDITERKQAEEALRSSEEKFSKIFKTSPNPVTIIRLSDGIFLDVNESFTRITGHPREEIVGRPYFSGNPDIWIHRKDRVRVVAALKKTGEVHGVEALFRNKGGKMIYGLISARALEVNGESCIVGIVNDITEQKRVEEALRKTQKQLKIIFDTVPALIWQKGLDEKYVTVNKAYCHTFGFSEGAVTGKTDHDVFPAEIAAQFVADDRKVLSTGIPELGIEEQIQKCSGEQGWNLTNKMVYYDDDGKVAGTIGFALDITELKQAEKALRDSEERHRIIIQTAMDGFWMVDLGGRLLEVNEAYCRMSGYSYQELLAMNIAELDANETKNEITAHIQQIRSQGESRFETRHRRKDGSIFDVEVSSKYRPTYGGGFEVFLRDITDRKQSEIALKKSKDRLRALSAHIQSVREEERVNIAREIHDDLGQLLTGLKMDLSWILRYTDPNQLELKEKAQVMGQLIDQTVKTVRRISTELRPRILDDFGLVAALEWQAEEFTKKTGITCRFRSTGRGFELKPDLSIAVFRIFQEALTNVVRHSGATKVEASFKKDAQGLVLTIRDNGRGISDAAIAQSNSLGLVGMRERALILGGTIAIKGKKGKGTSVILRLPVSKS